jgi:hypothetical protein
MALEELAAIGVVENDSPDDDYDQPGRAVHWSLKGDNGALIADTFAALKVSGRGWDEMWLSTTPPPQDQGKEDETGEGVPHTSSQPPPGLEIELRSRSHLTLVSPTPHLDEAIEWLAASRARQRERRAGA